MERSGEFMSADTMISALDARANFGKYLRRVENEGRSLVIQKRGTPRAVLISIREYLRLASPEPEVLRLLGEESKRKGTSALLSKQIDRIIRKTRTRRPKRR
jgi:prevent-host-death family protein